MHKKESEHKRVKQVLMRVAGQCEEENGARIYTRTCIHNNALQTCTNHKHKDHERMYRDGLLDVFRVRLLGTLLGAPHRLGGPCRLMLPCRHQGSVSRRDLHDTQAPSIHQPAADGMVVWYLPEPPAACGSSPPTLACRDHHTYHDQGI